MKKFENNKKIFEYLKSNNNDKLNDLKGFDLYDMIYYINCYYLELRNNLDLNNNVTFGLEIECEEADIDSIVNMIYKKLDLYLWTIDDDTSLNCGKEIISPILKDYTSTWNELGKICRVIDDYAIVGRKTSGHIHVGTQALGGSIMAWLNFLKLWAVYENVIFRFLYGEFLNARPSIVKYAPPCSKSFLENYDIFVKKRMKSLETILSNISRTRYTAVNVQLVEDGGFCKNNTIEFRCPNGTFETVIWQNNVNLLVKLLNYCKSSNFNDDIVDKRRSLINEKNMKLELYHEIYLDEALEFCDLVFDNNLDKIYFLRQYLKLFDVSYNCIGLEEAKCFVKKMHN